MVYDVAVIGAGISGCMIARELSFDDITVCVLEASPDIAAGATRANSGIVHAGFDALPGSMKALMNVRGNRMMPQVVKELGVPYDNCGSLVVAFDEQDEESLHTLAARARENDVPVTLLSGDEASQREPYLSAAVRAALWAPTGGIVSPFELAIAAAENAAENGVQVFVNCPVTSVHRNGDEFILQAGEQRITARFVVNAAGVYADEIARMAGAGTFEIRARRGEYVLFDRSQPVRTRSVIFGAPSEKGKGVLFGPTAHGNMIAGPTAEFTGKDDGATTPEGIAAVVEGVRKYVPDINPRHAITVFSGLRAVGNTKDFIIGASRQVPGFINVAAIESPGLTSAPAIAEYVAALLRELGMSGRPKNGAVRTRRPIEVFAHATPERKRELIEADRRYANVVCRCEHVTEAEIVQSIHRACGATSVDGVKLRTGAGFGRCHGGFCMPRVMDILAREMGQQLPDITKSGEGAWILAGLTKGEEQ